MESATKRVTKSVMCLTADPEVARLILVRSRTFAEIDHEIFFATIFLIFVDSRRTGDSYKQEDVHEILINCFVKHAQEKNVVM